jgi:hypothetical protein
MDSVWVFLLLSAEVMKTHKTNPYFRYTDLPHLRYASTNHTQCRTLQNSHLDHTPHPHRPDQHPRPLRELSGPSLRRGSRLPLGIRLHQVPRSAGEDSKMA